MPQTPLNILHILVASDAGGLSRYVFEMTCAMRALGHHITVAGDRGVDHPMFESAGIEWIELPLKGGPVAFYRCIRRLRQFLRERPVNLMHTHYRRATMLARRLQVKPRGLFASWRGQSNDTFLPISAQPSPPILYTLHLSHINISGPRRWLTDFGDHTHAASEDARQWLLNEARVPEERISLIPHGVDVSRYPLADVQTRRDAKRALGLDPEALVAAYVGRFDSPKNEAWVLDLAGATRGALPRVHFILVGGGPNEPLLRDRVDSENLHDRVHLFQYQPTLPIYQASDLLLLPSSREGFSLVCAEAMSVGVPVLRTRTSGTSELIVENITGRSVPIDHDQFIDAAVSMLHDRAALARMGLAAAHHVRDNFTFDRQLRQTIGLYYRLSGMSASTEVS